MASREVQSAYFAFFPRLQAVARGNYTDNIRGFSSEPYSATLIFQASIPIFEGGIRFAELTAKRANQRANRINGRKIKAEMEAGLKALGFDRLVIIRPPLMHGPRADFRWGEAIRC